MVNTWSRIGRRFGGTLVAFGLAVGTLGIVSPGASASGTSTPYGPVGCGTGSCTGSVTFAAVACSNGSGLVSATAANDAASTGSLDAQIGLGSQNYYGIGGEALVSPGTSQMLSEPLPSGSQTVRVIDASTNAVLASEVVAVNCSTPPTPPAVSLTGPTAVAAIASSAKVTWSGSDDGGPGIAKYQVRYTRAAYSGGFAAWSYPSIWQALTGTSLTQTGLARGYDYCWSVRAIDKAGNASGWSANRCSAIALDDRTLSVATSGWARATNSVWWNATATTSKMLNARLTRSGARLDRVGIVATKCASCGTIGIYVGPTLIGKISLYSARTAYRRLILLPKSAYRTGTVTVKVLTSGRTIQIDGLLISRT